MLKTCNQCKESFEITESDQAFYRKMEVPEPTFCPQCREQRRLAFRNERGLYKRMCDLCGKAILSTYNPQNPFKQYCNECYFSDRWEAQTYALPYDFQSSFFEQFKTLYDAVPKLNLYVKFCENCDYTNIVLHNKNGYLVFGSGFNQDSLYGTHIFYCENSLDCFFAEKCNECYQLIDCENCYRTRFSLLAYQCQESWFLYDCRNCKHCIGCWNLRNKEYYLFNKPVSPEQYQHYVATELAEKIADFQKIEALWNEILGLAIHKFQVTENSENVSGNFIYNSKNAFNCYNIHGCQDVKHLVVCINQKDSQDAMGTSLGEFSYDCLNNDYAHKTRWCMNSTYLQNCDYCDSCDNSKNLFGCVGLRHKEYCIFNKQYLKEEYEALLPKIIEQMRKAGEWGEYFPSSLSPFAYHETVANEYYPKICEQEKKSAVKIESAEGTLSCMECGKNYRIIRQESSFYRQHGLPLPKLCPYCRHLYRLKMRNPHQLFDRYCFQCGTAVKTNFSSRTSRKVFCEKCYLAEVY